MNTNGRYLCIRCPWEHLHTTESDRTATVWFLAGSGGIEHSAFSCRHAHCAERQTWEFLREIGYDEEGFEVIGARSERAVSSVATCSPGEGRDVRGTRTVESQGDLRTGTERTPQTNGESPDGHHAVLNALGAHHAPAKVITQDNPLDLPMFERNAETGKIKPKLPNIVLAFQRPDLIGAVLGWDEFKAEVAWRAWPLGHAFPAGRDEVWTQGQIRPLKDSDYVSLHLSLARLNFGPSSIPTELIRQAVTWIAEQRAFDSAINWLNSLPDWDGVSRVDTFCSRYLGTEDSEYTRAVARYWWTAHVARVLVPGCQADMAMVLISEQGTRKTSVLRHIVPQEDHFVELDIGERDDNLSRKLRGKLIGEMAELKGLNSKDIESIKAWVSRRHEEWVPKWQEFSRAFPRRLILVGTTNQDEFLVDETGNRRWLPMRVGRQQIDAVVRDRSQLWAEAVGLYLFHGICYAEAEQLAKAEHLDYMIHDDWESTIREWMFTDDGMSGAPASREYLLMSDILRGALGLAHHQTNMSTQFRVGRILRKMGYAKFYRRINGENHKVWMKATLEWVQRKE